MENGNIHVLVGDIRDPAIAQKIKALLPSSANVVLSDVAPKVSGAWEMDHARQIDLATQSLRLAIALLTMGGHFFTKAFQGDMFTGFHREVKHYFRQVKLIKPKATRTRSAELFVLGLRLKTRKIVRKSGPSSDVNC
jgi:23S rRNA (uridine2552-2'-O)-methyltransferase